MTRLLEGRTCLVTGATDGHGRALAQQLARLGADVIVHGRNPDKCERVRDEIMAEAGCKAPEILLCDLASRAEIDRAADTLLASGRPLHLLVNNAGLVTQRRQTSTDGHELVLAVNYLAMFQLTLRLLPRLRESGQARIVNISSDSYRIGKLDLDDVALLPFSITQAYARSKLAINYFTFDLARRIDGSGVSANAVDPGPVSSNIGANNPGLLYRLARPMIRYLFPSAARAARTALMVASDPSLEGATGGYYRSLQRREDPMDFDEALAARLWEWSTDVTGVPPLARAGGASRADA